MLKLSDEQAHALAAAVDAARRRPDLRAAVADVYRRVQAEIDERRPACAVSGRCCRFESYGHRLFVTTIELAVFAEQASGVEPAGTGGAAQGAGVRRPDPRWDGTGCPFQVNGLCGAHSIRPFGCRIYFCDASSTMWQQAAYERFHGELKSLHEATDTPYFYVEWREGLRAAGVAVAAGDAGAMASPGWSDPPKRTQD
jgi:Fe-S-cluster containining protein